LPNSPNQIVELLH